MRTAALLAFASAFALPAAAGDAPEFKDVFARRYPPGRAIGVVLQTEVPTRAARDTGIVRHERHYTVDVVDGEWRGIDSLGQVWDESFERGEMVRLTSVSQHGKRVDVRFESLKEHYVAGGVLGKKAMRPVATMFRLALPFEPRTEEDVARVLKHLDPLVRLFPGEEEARRYAAQYAGGGIEVDSPARPSSRGEVQVGMSQVEVMGLLGPPRDKVARGAKAEWRYPDRTVYFVDSQVTAVRFH